jgi:diguanylate cyclase (GGDEF)-like protein
MTRLINAVADLTDLRDRDELEVTLASVMFDLIGPSKLSLWRLVSHAGELRLRRRALVVSGNRTAIADTITETTALPRLNSCTALRACYDSKAAIRFKPGGDGQCCHVFPVVGDRDIVGLLEINHSTPLREYQERLVAGLLRIYRNHLRVLDDSEYDELTGLPNRKTFDDHFRRQASPQHTGDLCPTEFDRIGRRSASRADQQSWLAVVDIDFFKHINDRFGHLYGDEVLVLLARLMRSVLRETDRVFRFGGEEFVVILGPIEVGSAWQVLERCRAAIEVFGFPQVGRVTVSIGYTGIVTGETGSNAFGRADEALYVAKERGRNQVRSYEDLVAAGVLKTKTLKGADVELFAPEE